MPHASIDGFEMYYERHGAQGEPLVLVHGYTGDVSDWQHQIEEFAASHRVLVMDHRGHGRSGAPRDRESYTVERMSDDVEALVAQVGFGRYHLVGHSLGGMVAQEIALRSGGTPALAHARGHRARLRHRPQRARAPALRRRPAPGRGAGHGGGGKLPAPPRPPHHPRERFAQERARLARMPLDGFVGGWQALCRWPGTQQRAHAIRTPTLVICGELDAVVIPGSRWLAEAIPGARLEIVPEAGHSPQLERPELFNAALRRQIAASWV